MTGALDWLVQEDASVREQIVASLTQEERNEWRFHWDIQAREAQLAPIGDWRSWLILAGRGFGKTRAGAEWVRMIAENNSEARIALVSSSLTEARSVMVEGESGILACCPPERKPVFEASLRRVRFPNGAQAQLFSAAEPESLRGPQFSHARQPGAEGAIYQPCILFDRRTHSNRSYRFARYAAWKSRRRSIIPCPGEC